MNNFCSMQVCARLLFLILLSISFGQGSPAQTKKEVQIMVNGPWDYVEDPDNASRVILVGVLSDHHGPAVIFSGEAAMSYSGKTTLLSGEFSLNFVTTTCGSSTGSPKAYAVNAVSKNLIKQVVHDRTSYHPDIARYTISLPKPCYYVSHTERHSRVAPASAGSVPTSDGAYTTWMELHYVVPSISSANLVGSSDDGSIGYNDNLKFLSQTSSTAPAISVVLPAPTTGSDWECDSHSMESFIKSNLLFDLKLVAQFPMLDSNGQTTSYSANPKCVASIAPISADVVGDSSKTLIQIEQLEGYLAGASKLEGLNAKATLGTITKSLNSLFGGVLPDDVQGELKRAGEMLDRLQANKQGTEAGNGKDVLEKTEQRLIPFTVGSGDCNKAQVNINGVVK
jgi:hypothetical protein